MNSSDAIAAFSEELKCHAGVTLPPNCYLPDGVPYTSAYMPGLYQVENTRPDLYPGVTVSYLFLHGDATGSLYTDELTFYGEWKRPSYVASLPGEGLELLIGYERSGTCNVVQLA